jgi:hypothetical protein
MSCAIVATRTSRLPWRRSNLAPRASPLLLARRGAPLAHQPWKCRCLGARGRRHLPTQWPRRRSPCGSRSHRHRPRNRRHHALRSGSHGHRRARSRATIVVARVVANESGWGVKSWTLALRVFFYRRVDLVRLDRIAPSGLGFLWLLEAHGS